MPACAARGVPPASRPRENGTGKKHRARLPGPGPLLQRTFRDHPARPMTRGPLFPRGLFPGRGFERGGQSRLALRAD